MQTEDEVNTLQSIIHLYVWKQKVVILIKPVFLGLLKPIFSYF